MTDQPRTFTKTDCQHLEKELRDWGYGLLLCSPILPIPLILVLNPHGASMAPALLLGGVAGLALPLWTPGKPVWAGHIYAKDPATPSLHELQLYKQAMRLRKRRPMLLATGPFFTAVTFYLWSGTWPIVVLSFGDYFPGALCAFIYVFAVAHGVQLIQVQRALRARHKD